MEHGRAVFNQVFEDLELSFPAVSSDEKHPQFPDIFLYLVRGAPRESRTRTPMPARPAC